MTAFLTGFRETLKKNSTQAAVHGHFFGLRGVIKIRIVPRKQTTGRHDTLLDAQYRPRRFLLEPKVQPIRLEPS